MGVMSGLSLGTRVSNLKSVALTVLELLAFNAQKFCQKGAWPRSRDPLNFLALNANNSKTVKATDFKFDTRVRRYSPDVIPKNFPKRGRGHGHVTP